MSHIKVKNLTDNRILEMSGFMPVQQMHAVAPLSWRIVDSMLKVLS